MLLNVERLCPGGNCLGHADGQVVFVAGALPGETVEADIVEGKKDFLRAVVREVVTPSSHRVVPRCRWCQAPSAGSGSACGGCDFQHCDESYQVTLKNELLAELFRRAGFSHPPLLEPVTGEPWGYRSRFQFHRDAKTGTVGFQAAHSNAIVPIDDCLVAVPEIREMIRGGEITDRDGGTKKDGRAGRIVPTGAHRFTVFVPENCRMNLLGKTFAFSRECFFQSNLPLLERLIPATVVTPSLLAQTSTAVLDGLSGARALDLYSGVGVFARFLADSFAHVTLVEQNVEAVAWAETNLTGVPHESFAQSCADWVRARRPAKTGGARYDAVVCDPPRSGLEKPVAEWLCRTAPPTIRYVSCNPVTLVRDAAALCSAGYHLASVQLFDFYPQTHHIESLAVFDRM